MEPAQQTKPVEWCLEPLTLFDVAPPELVSLAAQAGFQYVSLPVHAALSAYPVWPLASNTQMLQALKNQMSRTGIRVLSLECFNLIPDVDVQAFRPALALGASLGATRAVCIAWENAEEDDIVRKLAATADLAAEFSMMVNLEFLTFCAGVPDLSSAVRIVQRAQRHNIGLVIDFLHVMRTGATPSDIANVPRRMIGHVQVCDGPSTAGPEGLLAEAGTNRMLPGSGAFPIRDMLAALSPQTILAIEAPMASLRASGVAPLEQAVAAGAAMRKMLQMGP